MLIENRTERQIELGKKIIQELIKRPQMPCGVLAGIIGVTEEETQALIDDLEYRGSIDPRVNKNFLIEAESMNIQLIQKELARRLTPEEIKNIKIWDLEKMLENALIRKGKIDGDIDPLFMRPNIENTTYIDKLLNYVQQPTNNSGNEEEAPKAIREKSMT